MGVHLLSINPTHVQGNSGVIRLSEPEDDNRDSLGLRIRHGNSSVLLTGDATGATTKRIIDNYYGDEEFLKVNVLIASHHGSKEHDCNSLEWIEATQPEYVIISNGYMQGHPHIEAYNNFQKSKRLIKPVKRHPVLVNHQLKSNKDKLHRTRTAIFSTLNNDTISVTLRKTEGVKVATVREGEIEKLRGRSHKGPAEKIEDVDIQERDGKLICTPRIPEKITSKIDREHFLPKPLSFEAEEASSVEEEEEETEEIKRKPLPHKERGESSSMTSQRKQADSQKRKAVALKTPPAQKKQKVVVQKGAKGKKDSSAEEEEEEAEEIKKKSLPHKERGGSPFVTPQSKQAGLQKRKAVALKTPPAQKKQKVVVQKGTKGEKTSPAGKATKIKPQVSSKQTSAKPSSSRRSQDKKTKEKTIFHKE